MLTCFRMPLTEASSPKGPKPRKRIKVAGYLTVEAEGDASEPGDVRCGIPGFDHPGSELHGSERQSTDPALRWEIRGRRHAAFATDFDYRSDS